MFGDIQSLKMIMKTSIPEQNYSKSMMGMEIEDYGVLVNVTTKHGNNISEVLEFIKGVRIEEEEKNGIVVRRKLVPIDNFILDREYDEEYLDNYPNEL